MLYPGALHDTGLGDVWFPSHCTHTRHLVFLAPYTEGFFHRYLYAVLCNSILFGKRWNRDQCPPCWGTVLLLVDLVSVAAATKHLMRQHMGFEEVPSRLDLRRRDFDVTRWHPLAIRDAPISATFGFHQAMYGVLQLAINCRAPVFPVFCDITIYYSYLKMLCSYWMQPLPLCHVHGFVCPLFGIWHPYKYSVDHKYGVFLPFMVALEYEGFVQKPAAGQLYAYPSLIVKERPIFAIYRSIPVYVLSYGLLLAVEHLK